MDNNKLNQAVESAKSWYQGHSAVVKGLFALALGVVCIAQSMGMIIKFSLFVLGVYLLYFGLSIFKVTAITDLVDSVRCCKK
jgi:uncharacterized membrane protein